MPKDQELQELNEQDTKQQERIDALSAHRRAIAIRDTAKHTYLTERTPQNWGAFIQSRDAVKLATERLEASLVEEYDELEQYYSNSRGY